MAFWAVAERARAARAMDRVMMLEGQAAAGAEILKGQAAVMANAVAEGLVKRAEETFRAQDVLAQAKLAAQLKPVADTLAKFEAQVTAVEKARAEQSGGLKAQIEVDGGVDVGNIRSLVEAGAEMLVAGSAVFGHGDPAAAVQRLLEAAR